MTAQTRTGTARVLVACVLVTVAATSVRGAGPEYRVFRPAGPGPHPAVIFAPGCSGFGPSFAPRVYDRLAEQLQGQGYVVLFADYFGRRGLTGCGAAISHVDAGKDVVAAAFWLKSQASVDAARIATIGWSFGGAAVLAALADHREGELGFSRAVVYYPVCRGARAWKAETPVLMLLAGDDDVAPPKACQDVVGANAKPETVRIVVYPGAHHAFDVSELPARMKYGFGTIGYQPEAAAAAWAQTDRFLKESR
jgi:dienelactone hydrolase